MPKSLRNLGLGMKLSLLVAASTGLTVIITIMLLSSGLGRVIERTGTRRLEQEVSVVEDQLARAEQAMLETANLMAATPGLVEAVASQDATRVRMVAPVKALQLGLDELDMVDADGEHLMTLSAGDAYDAEGKEGLLEMSLLGIEATGIIQGESQGRELLLAAAVPLRDESGAIVGALVAARKIDDEFLGEINFFRGDVDLALILGGEIVHRYVAEGETEDSGNEEGSSGTLGPQNTEGAVSLADIALDEAALEQASAGKTVFSDGFAFSPAGLPYAQAYIPLKVGRVSPEAVIAVQVNLASLSLFQRQITTLLTGALSALGLILVGAMALSVRYTVAAPLGKLQAAAERMAGGDYTQRAQAMTMDEVGRLADTFNRMAGAIQQRETELTEANHELTVARKQAEDANRLKSEFLATMSHELRTPLNAIIGYSQIITEGMTGELTEKQLQFHERILLNGKNLLGLIDDVLNLAKIEAGRITIVRKPIVLRDWLNEVVDQIKGLADEKGLTFEVELDSRMPSMIVGDPDRLKQIALNLLSNAIKFTDEGRVGISIEERGRNSWALVVSDTGIGIPSHAQEYIFEEFRQVDGTTQRKHGGTGLGLAIVRQLTLMMGGSVRVRSALGEGSTFTVILPLITDDQLAVEQDMAGARL